MAARITVSVLSELLGRSQTVTDANREKLLQREAEQRAKPKQLEAKRLNQEAARRRRGPLDDPTGRNIFTAPALLRREAATVGALWYSFGWVAASLGNENRIVAQVKAASADGLNVETFNFSYEWTFVDMPPPATPAPTGQQVIPVFYLQFFPAPQTGVLLTVDVREGWFFFWPERTFGTTAITPGALLGRWGAVAGASTCDVITVTNVNESSLFAQSSGNFYPDFEAPGSEVWTTRSEQTGVEILNAPPEATIPSAYSPVAYAVNSAWGTLPADIDALSTAFEGILIANSLPNVFEPTQGTWPSATAAPTEAGVDMAALEAAATAGGYGSPQTSGGSTWQQVLAYDFGQTGYVGASYNALVDPLVPPP